MKGKKRWFVTALTACLTLSLGICAEALEYDFDGVEDTEYYPSTSYESLYGAKYNYGGSNATDYQWPALPYGGRDNQEDGPCVVYIVSETPVLPAKNKEEMK